MTHIMMCYENSGDGMTKSNGYPRKLLRLSHARKGPYPPREADALSAPRQSHQHGLCES